MENLIENHIGYAHAIAAEVSAKYSNPDRRDLESSAELGLVLAARDYDPSRGVSFATFAYYRIRGAIYDELRQTCRISKFETAANDYMLEHTSNGSARSRSNPLGDLEEMTSHLVTTYLLSLEELPHQPASANTESALDQLLLNEERDRVRQALQRLPGRYRQVLEAYYYEDLSFKEIGNQLGLSESWVSRIHAKGLSLLRNILQHDGEGSALDIVNVGPGLAPVEADPRACPERSEGVGATIMREQSYISPTIEDSRLIEKAIQGLGRAGLEPRRADALTTNC